MSLTHRDQSWRQFNSLCTQRSFSNLFSFCLSFIFPPTSDSLFKLSCFTPGTTYSSRGTMSVSFQMYRFSKTWSGEDWWPAGIKVAIIYSLTSFFLSVFLQRRWTCCDKWLSQPTQEIPLTSLLHESWRKDGGVVREQGCDGRQVGWDKLQHEILQHGDAYWEFMTLMTHFIYIINQVICCWSVTTGLWFILESDVSFFGCRKVVHAAMKEEPRSEEPCQDL